jgi:YD repeat-containing protein
MKILSVILLMFSISSAFARADVSLRNGNFFTTFNDLSYPGGLEPKIERTYNSKSDYKSGLFGFGWGTEYDTYLKVEADGSVIVTEYGGGAENRFVPKNFKTQQLNSSINAMVEVAKKSRSVSTPTQIKEYRDRLTSEPTFRSKQFQAFVTQGLMPANKVSDGMQLTSTQYFYQYITKVKGGYTRVMEAGAIQKFNEAGRMVQMMDRNKNYINFTYNGNGKIIKIDDNLNRKIELSYGALGYLEKVKGSDGKTASFKYSPDGLLVYSKDMLGSENTYQYTADEFKNISEIGYPNDKDDDGKPKSSKMMITYYGPDKNSSVKTVTNRSGTKNEYEYIMNPSKPDYYSVKVVLKNAMGTVIRKDQHEYFIKKKPDGEKFTWKLVSNENGEVTETINDERLGFPIQISLNGKITKMSYDAKGRMTKKQTPNETLDMTYHPTVGKLSKLSRRLKSGTLMWSQFDYDPTSGNLITAKNSDKKSVKIIYDANGRMRALVDQAGRQLTFRYNEQSKPIEISDAKAGSIKIIYKNTGEVDRIESNGGQSTAADVLRAIQNLGDITAPAGVSLTI